MKTLEDLVLEMQKFSLLDYLFFTLMLLVCVAIGLYFCLMNKSKNEADYLMGGRTMMVLPIALSLIASFISGITLLGLPTEIYAFGIQYIYVIFGVVTMGFMMGYIYLPVFHELEITSTYEYLERRFNKHLRTYGAIMFTIMNIGYLPIVIYVPALAFNQVTGISIHVITPIICFVCIFYTCVGGLKAVVWTDVVQTFSMFSALILVAVRGSYLLGGVGVVFDKAWNSGRIEYPSFDMNPIVRHTIWTQVIGGSIYWLQTNAVSQNMIQRYLSLPTVKAGRRALWTFIVGVILLILLCTYCGLLIYATYETCDPLTTKLARAKDQLFPLYVMSILGDFPGLTGIFVAGIFSAALSSLSTCLNSMSAVILEDFVKPFTKAPLSERCINWIMRSVVVVVGILCLILVGVVEKMGTVLQLTMSLEAITNGPLLGIFTIGFLMPWINSKSALYGGITGVIVMSWISLNAQISIASGALSFAHKPMSVEGCTYSYNATVSPTASEPHLESSLSRLYGISYMWYTLLGALVCIVSAQIFTAFLGRNDIHSVPLQLLAPFVRGMLKNKGETNARGNAVDNKVIESNL